MNSHEPVFKDIERFLYALRDAGSKYSLDRISRIASSLGNPQNNYPVIHVAGTNGKGSVCAMLEAILRESGLRVGLYTSPHLVNIGERVQIDREILSEKKFAEEILSLRKLIDSIFDTSDKPNYPSFFEYVTALAFDVFSKSKVDAAVIEVGLGGLWDSTNIVSPEISVITSIGYDHTQMLGSRLCEIASQKAGIIKRGIPVVCGFLPKEAMNVIEEKARELSSPIYKVEDYYKDDDSLPKTSLEGHFQRRNAAVASLVIKILRGKNHSQTSSIFDIPDDLISKALSKVSWDARWQQIKLPNGAILILDASHNEEGARALEGNLRNLVETTGKHPYITVGVLGRERAVPLLKVVEKYARKIWLLVPNQPRALSHKGLRECMDSCDVPIIDSSVREIFPSPNYCTIAKDGDIVVSTGSIYLAGEIMAALSGKKSDSLQDRP